MGTETTYTQVVEWHPRRYRLYSRALDDGRNDLVATFCSDGACEIPGMGTQEGHDALRATYATWKPVRPQRHLVVNTLVTNWNDDEAHAGSDVIFILKGQAGWAIQLVGRYHDLLHHADGGWRFHRRTARFVT